MSHSGSRTHQLDFAGLQLTTITHAVLVPDRPGDHIAENFHIAMGMGRESCTGSDLILIDHPQAAEPHVRWIVIIGEAEAVIGIQPTVVRVASFGGATNGKTGSVRFHDVWIISRNWHSA